MKISKRVIEQSSIIASVTKWLLLSGIIGIVIGMIVTGFLKLLHYSEHGLLGLPFHSYYLLPFGLMVSVWLTKTFAPDAKGHGTEKVIESIHKKDGNINIAVIPVKLAATIVTLATGGSAGKEGPGAQIGAGTASYISNLFKFSKRDRKKLVVCGISAGFATVFGTPIAGAIFGIEILIVGAIRYDLLLPSIVAGFSAFFTAQYMGATYTYYDISYFQHYFIDLMLIAKVVLGGIFFGLIAYMIIATLKKTEDIVEHIPMNPYTKAFLAGMVLVALSFPLGNSFFGLGIETISRSMEIDSGLSADIPWYAFIAKMFYTSVTLGAGGSGGIVTPIFFIGATSGHLFGGLFGGDNQLALFAALGFVSVLAGATNSPIAAMIMAMELFGMDVAHYAALSVTISFLITGHRSVFPSQKISMRKSELLDIDYGEDIEHSRVSLTEKNAEHINKLRKKVQDKRQQAEERRRVARKNRAKKNGS